MTTTPPASEHPEPDSPAAGSSPSDLEWVLFQRLAAVDPAPARDADALPVDYVDGPGVELPE